MKTLESYILCQQIGAYITEAENDIVLHWTAKGINNAAGFDTEEGAKKAITDKINAGGVTYFDIMKSGGSSDVDNLLAWTGKPGFWADISRYANDPDETISHISKDAIQKQVNVREYLLGKDKEKNKPHELNLDKEGHKEEDKDHKEEDHIHDHEKEEDHKEE